MMQMILGALFTISILVMACLCFYAGYRYGIKRNNIKVELTTEQLEVKRKREQLENQFDRMFSYSIHKAKEKKVN